MITYRPADERGRTRNDWLDSRHTFSFGHYRDPAHMGFGHLRVINDDRVLPATGFGTHGHRDMEIVSYVLEGTLAHRDSLGTGSVIRPGDVQRMSAGTGIEHSEFNASRTDPVHFLQIWILPERAGLAPSYEQRHFETATRRNRFCLVADREGSHGSITIHQDARIYSSILTPGEALTHAMDPHRRGWLQIASGSIRLGKHPLAAGDGISFVDESAFTIESESDAEVLFFDLA